MKKAQIDTIPPDLIRLVPAVQTAATLSYSQTRDEKTAALIAAAITYGSEDDVVRYFRDDSSSPETRQIAGQVLGSIHPDACTWGLVIKAPWHKPTMKELTIGLAERRLAQVCRNGRLSADRDVLQECAGYGRLLQDAEENAVKLGKRGTQLMTWCSQIGDAVRRNELDARIGYAPVTATDDRQMTFCYY